MTTWTLRLYAPDGRVIAESTSKAEIAHAALTYDGNQYEVDGKPGWTGTLTDDMEDFHVSFSLRGGGGNVPMSAPVWFGDIGSLLTATLMDNRYDLSVEWVEADAA